MKEDMKKKINEQEMNKVAGGVLPHFWDLPNEKPKEVTLPEGSIGPVISPIPTEVIDSLKDLAKKK